jgi:hypothetical protein
MFRLMKSERMVLDHAVYGPLISYRQKEIQRFGEFSTAFAACEIANDQVGMRHYILDGYGKEYYAGTWID